MFTDREEDGGAEGDCWDFSLLQSRHVLEDGAVVLLWQSIQHRLIPLVCAPFHVPVHRIHAIKRMELWCCYDNR